MAIKVSTLIISYGSLVFMPLFGVPNAIAETSSADNQNLRDDLTPAEPPPIESGSAADLGSLDPDPDLLDLPQDESDVTIDVTEPITLQDALVLARRNNRDIQVAESSVKQAQARFDRAKSTRLPRVDLAGNENRISRNQDIFVTNNPDKPDGEGGSGQGDCRREQLLSEHLLRLNMMFSQVVSDLLLFKGRGKT